MLWVLTGMDPGMLMMGGLRDVKVTPQSFSVLPAHYVLCAFGSPEGSPVFIQTAGESLNPATRGGRQFGFSLRRRRSFAVPPDE